MSLEQKIGELIEAVNQNTEAVLLLAENNSGEPAAKEEKAPAKRGRKPAADKAAPAKKTAAKRGRAKKPAGPDMAAVREALREVSQLPDGGKEVAKEILGEFDAKKIADLEESDYAEVIEACKEAMEEEGDGDDENGDDDDDI